VTATDPGPSGQVGRGPPLPPPAPTRQRPCGCSAAAKRAMAAGTVVVPCPPRGADQGDRPARSGHPGHAGLAGLERIRWPGGEVPVDAVDLTNPGGEVPVGDGRACPRPPHHRRAPGRRGAGRAAVAGGSSGASTHGLSSRAGTSGQGNRVTSLERDASVRAPRAGQGVGCRGEGLTSVLKYADGTSVAAAAPLAIGPWRLQPCCTRRRWCRQPTAVRAEGPSARARAGPGGVRCGCRRRDQRALVRAATASPPGRSLSGSSPSATPPSTGRPEGSGFTSRSSASPRTPLVTATGSSPPTAASSPSATPPAPAQRQPPVSASSA